MIECTHKDQINEDVKPQAQGCVDCLKSGDNWVNVRKCMTCAIQAAVTHPKIVMPGNTLKKLIIQLLIPTFLERIGDGAI